MCGIVSIGITVMCGIVSIGITVTAHYIILGFCGFWGKFVEMFFRHPRKNEFLQICVFQITVTMLNRVTIYLDILPTKGLRVVVTS